MLLLGNNAVDDEEREIKKLSIKTNYNLVVVERCFIIGLTPNNVS